MLAWQREQAAGCEGCGFTTEPCHMVLGQEPIGLTKPGAYLVVVFRGRLL